MAIYPPLNILAPTIILTGTSPAKRLTADSTGLRGRGQPGGGRSRVGRRRARGLAFAGHT